MMVTRLILIFNMYIGNYTMLASVCTLMYVFIIHTGPFIVMLGHILGDVFKFGFLYLEFYIPYG